MNLLSNSLLLRFAAAFLVTVFTMPTARAMDLRWLGQAGGVARLDLSRASEGPVHLEGSFDLQNWFLLDSQIASGGAASFSHTNPEPVSFQFYRAVAKSVTPSPVVGPQTDPTLTASTVVTPQDGGELFLTDRRGVHYHLLVSSNLVVEPVAIAMTVVTNFAALPWEDRFRAAVVFEPDGLEFLGSAELRIQFPEPVPELEMVGYAFAEAGAGFHLKPWETSPTGVVIPVAHFSGAGVSAVPLPPAPQPAMNYEEARRTTRDAERSADQWAGERLREVSRRRQRGELSADEFAEQARGTRTLRNRLVFLTGIKPLLQAATRDCAVGEVVLNRFERLERDSGSAFGGSLQFPELVALAPQVRCRCAHEYLELCETKPSTSGRGARTALDAVLNTTARITGRTDAQGCDLGTDTEIDRRFAKAACHKAWEGKMSYTEDIQNTFEMPIPDNPGPTTSYTLNTRRETTAFSGTLDTLTQTDGDVPDENGEGGWAFWKFQTKGKLTGTYGESRITILLTPDFTSTDSYLETAKATYSAIGDLSLRINDGQTVAWVSYSAGLDDTKYPMAHQGTSEFKVECKPLHELRCPDSIPAETKPAGTYNIAFAAYGSSTTANTTLTYTGDKVTAKYHRVRITISPKPIRETNTVVETWTAELWRGEGP
ncbi:MAG: hypothetical protein IT580_18025 [Verrucomicrobiales bacterium]|nr:hypothetical protein [Verrucomicrobiales bacterium]